MKRGGEGVSAVSVRCYFCLPLTQSPGHHHLQKGDTFLKHQIKSPPLGQLLCPQDLPRLYHGEECLLLKGVGNIF